MCCVYVWVFNWIFTKVNQRYPCIVAHRTICFRSNKEWLWMEKHNITIIIVNSKNDHRCKHRQSKCNHINEFLLLFRCPTTLWVRHYWSLSLKMTSMKHDHLFAKKDHIYANPTIQLVIYEYSHDWLKECICVTSLFSRKRV